MKCEFIPSLQTAYKCKKCGRDYSDKCHSYLAPPIGRHKILTQAQELKLFRAYAVRGTFKTEAQRLGVSVSGAYKIVRRVRAELAAQ